MEVPKLLERLAIEGAVVTFDAMGCRRAYADRMLKRRADYVDALKGNEGELRGRRRGAARRAESNDFRDTTVSCSGTVEGDTDASRPAPTVIHDVAGSTPATIPA